MPKTIRYHLDENVGSTIASGLRLRGIDVTTTTDAAIRTSTDESQMDFAKRTSRVLFTQDADLLELAPLSVPHPGVFYCKQGKRSIGSIIRELEEHWLSGEPADLADLLIVL